MQTPNEFIAKWKASTLKERSASQEHFLDLCRLIGHHTPAQSDPAGEHFTFERGASKTGSGQGWADVWKKGCFAWEYKGKKKDLNTAFAQLQRYAIALENPPLLVVSDMETIVIHTNWTNTVQEIHTIAIEELEKPEVLQKLRWLFNEPERLKPGVTREMITEKAASTFAGIAQRLRDAGNDGHRVAHFVNKLIFAMFAEDIGILPGHLFTRLVESVQQRPDKLSDKLQQLFSAMKSGGDFGVDEVPWFNGGLFDDQDALPLDSDSVKQLLACCRLDWSDIEPAIFGTLFERGLDPSKRSQLGAHYTDRNSIMRIVGPVVIEPLEREWNTIKIKIQTLLTKGTAASNKKAEEQYNSFMAQLRKTRVLDPACGSGNFLYLSLIALKSLEHRIMLEAEALGLHRDFPQVGPQNVMGIEINDYAAELARVSVWIGDIQWNIKNGMGYSQNPILQSLNNIENRDALMNEDGSESQWPDAECIVGNPPFLGDKRMIAELGEEYTTLLRKSYFGRVSGGADLVTYWHEKSRAAIADGRSQRAGLVSTNSIRQKRNRSVLECIRESGRIYSAWSDEPWINEGAAVRVSLVCFDAGSGEVAVMLDGQPVAEIYPDLTGRQEGIVGTDITTARPLATNIGRSFFGLCLAGEFAVPGKEARQWLLLPNPHGRPNSDVLRPIYNGADILKGFKDRWVIDFGTDMKEEDAALYEAPFAHVLERVKPVRQSNRESVRVDKFWRLGRPRPELRKALVGLDRYVATVETAKHRIFVWFPVSVAPEHSLIVIPRSDDATFGILSSRFHVAWALAQGGTLEDRPRYNSTRCLEPFPFPEGFTLNIPATEYADKPNALAIASAARRLVELRDNWLNPPEWVQRVPEVVPGYPDRILPINDAAAAELKKRTLTNLYNARPAWLANVHAALDAAVASAYGWEVDISDDEVLHRLLELNQERTEGK
ncbi:MAG: class I SAM-dependent DNA methyltransferase [Desulfuromonadales bacterium]|nr:class I SAM-dependent DNA methyltransferase [Desulfuromonadales bacterium]